MSRPYDLFVDNFPTIDDVRQTLERCLGVRFIRHDSHGELLYDTLIDNIYLMLSSHEYENDAGIDFESYKFDLSIEPHGIFDGNEALKRQAEYGLFVFEKLKHLGIHKIMLIENLQKVVARFSPLGQ